MMDKLTDRLRGTYSCGPHLPNGPPEFGWRQFQSTPINEEAAERIEDLEIALLQISSIIEMQREPDIDAMHDVVRVALLKPTTK